MWSASSKTSGRHSGCAINSASGCSSFIFKTSSPQDLVMCGQCRFPGNDFFVSPGFDIGSQIFIRHKDNFIGFQGVYYLYSIGGRTTDIRLSLDSSRSVNIADNRGASGCLSFSLLSPSISTISAIGQVASISGRRTVLSGQRIAALSPIKWTPQKTITSAV